MTAKHHGTVTFMSRSAISRYFSSLGKKGAKAAHAKRTKLQQNAISSNAARARWDKAKKKATA